MMHHYEVNLKLDNAIPCCPIYNKLAPNLRLRGEYKGLHQPLNPAADSGLKEVSLLKQYILLPRSTTSAVSSEGSGVDLAVPYLQKGLPLNPASEDCESSLPPRSTTSAASSKRDRYCKQCRQSTHRHPRALRAESGRCTF